MVLGKEGAKVAGPPYQRAWIAGSIDYGGGLAIDEWWWHGIKSFQSEPEAKQAAANAIRQWENRHWSRKDSNPAPEVQHVAWRETCECSCGDLVHEVDVEAWIVRETTWDGHRDTIRERVRPLTQAEATYEGKSRTR